MDKKSFLLILTCTVYAAFLGELMATSIYYVSRNPSQQEANQFFANFDTSYSAESIIQAQFNFLDNSH